VAGEGWILQLVEALDTISIPQLRQIALTAGVDPEQPRRTAIEQVADRLTDHVWLTARMADLTDEEWAALKVVFWGGGEQGITVELCQQIVNLLSGRRRHSSTKALQDLQAQGLLFIRTQNYRQIYFIPQDLGLVLGDILNRQMSFRISLPADQSVEPLPVVRDLLEEVHRFLAFCYKHEVTLTQQGLIYKRHLRALLELFGSDQSEDEHLVGRYPEPLGFLVGFSLEQRLVLRDEGRLSPTEELTRWVERPESKKRGDLFRYWQDRYYYQDLQAFLSVMRTVGPQWVSVPELVQEIEPLINPSQRGSFFIRLQHHLENFLGPMGLFEVGHLRQGDEQRPLCRITPIGSAIVRGESPGAAPEPTQATLVVQATFEILAPRPVAAEALWNLELMGDLTHKTDRTLTYRLSRQSVYRAFKAGMTGDAMLAFLEAHSTTGVPQNLRFDLKSWASGYGQVYLQRAALLRCATPVLAAQIKVSRRTAKFIIGELTPTILLVDPAGESELLAALEADGLMPRPNGE
jgi:hypothetical protein